MVTAAGSSSYSTSMRVDRFVGDCWMFRGNGDDRLANEAHPVDGQDRPVFERMAVVGIDCREISPGHDRDHAGQRLCPARVDAR